MRSRSPSIVPPGDDHEVHLVLDDFGGSIGQACLEPELRGIDPQNITYYFRRVMVIPGSEASGMAVWRKSLFAMMHLNANLPAAYFGVPPAQVVELGLEVEI